MGNTRPRPKVPVSTPSKASRTGGELLVGSADGRRVVASAEKADGQAVTCSALVMQLTMKAPHLEIRRRGCHQLTKWTVATRSRITQTDAVETMVLRWDRPARVWAAPRPAMTSGA
jgi:hypothetical protein